MSLAKLLKGDEDQYYDPQPNLKKVKTRNGGDLAYEFDPNDCMRLMVATVRAERDKFTARHLFDLRHKQVGSFEKMVFSMGSRAFKNWKLADLQKIPVNKQFDPYTITDVAGSSQEVAAAAIRVARMLDLYTDAFKDTGQYKNSLAIFVREVGGRDIEVSVNDLKEVGETFERLVVSFIYMAPYAGHLETIQRSGKVQGTLYFMKGAITRGFPGIFAKFDWLAPRRAPTNHNYPIPRLQIASPENLKGSSKKPKRKQWWGKRKTRRGRIRNASNGQFATNPTRRRF